MIVRQLRRPAVWLPISGILLALLVWRSRLWDAPTTLARLDPAPLVLGLALNVVVVAMWGLRSHRLLASAGQPIGRRDATSLATMAFALNAVTPASVGEAVRAAYLRQGHGVDYPTGAAIVLSERFVAMFYLTGSSALAWAVRGLGVPLPAVVALWCLLVPAPLVVRRVGFMGGFVRAAGSVATSLRSERLSSAAARTDIALRRMVGSGRPLLFFAATSAAIFASYALQLTLVVTAIGARLDLLDAWACLGLAMTAGVVSLLPFGLGSTDVTLTALLVAVGLTPLEAAAAAFGYRVVATLPLGVAGVLAYWRESYRLRSDSERA